MRAFFPGLLLLLFSSGMAFGSLASSPNHEPDSRVDDLLIKVAHAVQHTNYRARLTYEHAGQLDLIEVAHAVIDGLEYERVDYLNGPHRAISYGGESVECAAPGRFLLRGGKIPVDESFVALSDNYHLNLLGIERIAGRSSYVVQMLPRDNDRHGFILAFDKKNYLPTRSLIVADGGRVLERFHFVDLATEVAFERSYFDVPLSQDRARPCNPQQKPEGRSPWQPQWLPKGFVFFNYRYSENDGHMETYTDGLASFSLFTQTPEQLVRDGGVLASSSATRGASVILMRLLANGSNSVHVSFVGEIPSETAARIVSSLKLRKL